MVAQRSLADVLGYAGERTLGFPLFLYLVRGAIGLVGAVSVETFVDVVCGVLLLVHVASSVLFFSSVRTLIERELGWRLHPAALVLLLAYPALVAYTAVPLTDTLATDGLMLAVCALERAESAAATGPRLAWSTATGVALAAVVLLRPAAIVPCAVLVVAGVIRAVVTRAGRGIVASAAVAFVVLVGLHASNCARAYGTVCLTEPQATERAVAESVGRGVTSARHYWSSHSSEPDGRVVTPDPLLAATLGADCHPTTLLGAHGMLACLVSHPLVLLPFFTKKAVGLFDSYYLQPYAVDVTPRWARLASRPFGALAFAGFVATWGWLVAAVRHRRLGGLLPLVLLVPLAHVGWQSLFHVEPRYGLPAVPFALVGLVLAVQALAGLPPRSRALLGAGLACAAVLSLVQTHWWDAADDVLRLIEQG
jgi:hypothetical protein